MALTILPSVYLNFKTVFAVLLLCILTITDTSRLTKNCTGRHAWGDIAGSTLQK